MTDDYVSDLRAFCAEWLKQNRGYDLIDHGFGTEHGGELTTDKLTAALDELERLREFVGDAKVEWASDAPGFFIGPPLLGEINARHLVSEINAGGGAAVLKQRLVGEWKAAEQQPECHAGGAEVEAS